MSFPVGAAHAQYPTRPLRLIVPFAAGGLGTSLGNVLGSQLSKLIGQNIVVDPHPGAGGIIGFDYVKKTLPDGYTVLLGTVSTANIAPALYKRLPFDIRADFEPVAEVATSNDVIVVPQNSPYRTLADLLSDEKNNPGAHTCGSSGVGSTLHLVCVLLNKVSGTKFVHIPYTGVAPALTGLMRGDTTMMVSTTDALPFIKAGQLRALGVTSAERWDEIPDVPTIRELGYPDLEHESWYGLLAPKGTDPSAIRILSEAVTKLSTTREWKDSLRALGMVPAHNTDPESFRRFIDAQLDYWRPIVKSSGAQLDF